MSSRGYTIIRVLLDKRATDPPPKVGRIYFNTVENRPKICVEQ